VSFPDWLADRVVENSCQHDFSITRDIDQKDLPPYVTGPISERFCANCGEKESLRHRITADTNQPVPAYLPPAPARSDRPTLLPIPVDQIKVTLQLEKYGKRYDNNRKAGNRDQAINVGPDPRWNDAMAAAAEEYVALALGLAYTGDIDKPDRGWDMAMQGRRIQVKWTKYEDGKLIVSPKQTMAADYYVLVTGPTTDDFRIRGWATAKELKSSTTDLGYGITYALPQERLRPLDSLLEIRNGGL
jgi:hypothetical protein